MLQYTVNLKTLIVDCGYGNVHDNQICDQVLTFCRDEYFQERLAKEKGELTLEIAHECDQVQQQLASLKMSTSQNANATGTVSKVDSKKISHTF